MACPRTWWQRLLGISACGPIDYFTLAPDVVLGKWASGYTCRRCHTMTITRTYDDGPMF